VVFLGGITMDIKTINGEYLKLGKTSITIKKQEDISKNKRRNYKIAP
jgi:hypothetical protein